MDESDLYGDDIYGDTLLDFNNASAPSGTVGDGTENHDAEPPLHKPDERQAEQAHSLATVQHQLQQATAELEQWRAAFRDELVTGTGAVDEEPQPLVVAQTLKSMQAEQQRLKEEVDGSVRRESALHLQLAEKNMENISLRKQLQTARQAADPHILQLRQLLLDPAVQKEFQRLRKEVEDKAREAKTAQEELQAVTFSQESKAGRMLMAKCRALQDENEEMGRELSEGKVHGLERQLGMTKDCVEELKKNYMELEDHCHALDEENEELQQEIFTLRAKLTEASEHLPQNYGLILGKGAGGDRKYGNDRQHGVGMGIAPNRSRLPPLMDKDGDAGRFAGRKRMR